MESLLFVCRESIDEELFLSEQPLRDDAAAAAYLDELVRLDDGPRFGGVLEAHDVVEPGFLPHRVDVGLAASELLDNVDALTEVRSGQAARLVHPALESIGQERPVEPRERRAVAFHAQEQRVDLAE